MNKIQVNGVFLEGGDVIAQTFSVNNLGDISTRQGGVSNRFNLPLSDLNRKTLGFPEDLNTTSRNPYIKVDATLYDENTPIAEGFLKIEEVINDSIEVTFFSDNSGWFNLIKDKTLKDLYLDDLDHDWTGANIRASFSHTSADGYIYPFIEYGRSYNSTIASTNFSVSNFYPAVYVKRIFEQIFYDVGYSIEGDLLNLWEYHNSIIPFSAKDFTHSPKFISDKTQVFTVEDQTLNETFDKIQSDPNTLTVLEVELDPLITYEVNVQLEIDVFSSTGNIFLAIFDDYPSSPSNFESLYEISGTGSYGFTYVIDFSTATNNIVFDFNAAASFTLGISSGFISFTPIEEIQPNDPIQIANNLPEISQSDFIKYICNLYGVVPITNKFQNKISFNLFKNIKGNIPSAVDWSDKFDIDRSRSINFSELIGEYGNLSIFNYLNDDDDTQLQTYKSVNNLSFGAGILTIDNEYISNRKEVYEAPFGATINILSISNELYIPQIKWFNASLEKEFDIVPRILLIIPEVDVSELTGNVYSQIQVSGTNVSQIPFAWFAKAPYVPTVDAYQYSLSFGDIAFTIEVEGTLSNYWEEYAQALSNMKYLKADFLLNSVDIANLDFNVPVYIDYFKSYFYINSVNEFTGSEDQTEVELIKIA